MVAASKDVDVRRPTLPCPTHRIGRPGGCHRRGLVGRRLHAAPARARLPRLGGASPRGCSTPRSPAGTRDSRRLTPASSRTTSDHRNPELENAWMAEADGKDHVVAEVVVGVPTRRVRSPRARRSMCRAGRRWSTSPTSRPPAAPSVGEVHDQVTHGARGDTEQRPSRQRRQPVLQPFLWPGRVDEHRRGVQSTNDPVRRQPARETRDTQRAVDLDDVRPEPHARMVPTVRRTTQRKVRAPCQAC